MTETAAFSINPGWVEFQVTASDLATRVACFTMLRTLLSGLRKDRSITLLPDHQPQLELETVVALPISVTKPVTELALFLLRLCPYLGAMDQAGLRPVASAR
jgi:hypothetical protein